MYKDLISYELAENITEQELLKVAQEIITTWMSKQPGFITWEINKNKTAGYTDIVCWETELDAKNCEKEMVNIPNAAQWFGCYKPGSISSINVTTIEVFN